jgi:glycine betaine catabolism B
MKISVKGSLRDLFGFIRLKSSRQKRFAKASPQSINLGRVNALASQLHPKLQNLVITEIRDETKTTKTFRMEPDQDAGTQKLAYFRAGQYLSLKVEVDQVEITRPYSIASAPHEALGENGFYELTIRKVDDGFFTPHVWENWSVGTKVTASGPCGQFYHEPIRDGSKIVGLAGGSGVTPFYSMAKEIVSGDMDAELLLLYGSSDKDDIVFYELLGELEAKSEGKIKVVHVLSCDEAPLPDCEQGFITSDLIKKYADVDNSTFFFCGPEAMYAFVMQELAAFDLPPKRIRREVYGEVSDVTQARGFPQAMANQSFELTVHIGGLTAVIPCQATETVLVAMERAGLAPPSECRSGTCGVCHSLLVAGDVYVHPHGDGRRAADRQFGFIHPCSSYPISDLELSVSRST